LALAVLTPDYIVECGASEVLAPMIKRLPNIGSARVLHVADVAGLEDLRETLRSVTA
jgi:hypothetical protein